MSPKDQKANPLSRRDFFKVTGLTGLGTLMASTGLGPTLAGATDDKTVKPAGSPTMPRRRLGKTEAQVSILSLGGMFDTVNNQLLLKQAFNWGINHWDTAEGYGGGLSEEGIGRWFSRNPTTRKEIFLVTKSHTSKPAELTRRLDQSLGYLKTDYVDLYFYHGASKAEELTPEMQAWAAQAKKSGKIKFFGFSTHSNMEECLLGASKLPWIDVVMFTYNYRLMATPKMKEAVAAMVKADVGLVAMKTQGGGPVQTDSETELQLAGRFLEKGFTDKQAKLKAVWEHPHIATICSQMPTLSILAANVAAARDQTKLSRSDLDLMSKYAMETGHGYCAGCTRLCMAAVDNQVPVGDVMRGLMYYRDYGDRDLARSVYTALPSQAKTAMTTLDFSMAERVCPQGLPIADLMQQAATLLA